MQYTVKTEFLPEKEFVVIRGYGRLYDPDIPHNPDPEKDTWKIIRRQLADGTVNRLKKAAGSESVYMLFCNTCIRKEDEKCYICGYDIACENLIGSDTVGEFDIVRLNSCEYAVFDCTFDNETKLEQAHDKPDGIFWGEWLKDNPYVSAIDNPENWTGNGFAAIEQYSPLDPEAKKYSARFYYPILKKDKR